MNLNKIEDFDIGDTINLYFHEINEAVSGFYIDKVFYHVHSMFASYTTLCASVVKIKLPIEKRTICAGEFSSRSFYIAQTRLVLFEKIHKNKRMF